MDLDTLFKDREELVNVLNSESDIGCILVSVSFLDQCLGILLKDIFIKSSATVDNILKPDGLLGEFSSKAKLCYCLSLIDKKKYSDLVKIAEIRNHFAHSHILLSFNNLEIQNKCKELKSYEGSLNMEHMESMFDNPSVIARQIFVHTATNIINDIMARGYLNRILHK